MRCQEGEVLPHELLERAPVPTFERLRAGARSRDILLRLCGLTLSGLVLCGLLLSALFGEVSAHHAAADRADNSMVPRVMPGDAAHYRTLDAACGVRRACRSEDQRGCNQGDSYRASFHSKIL